MPEQDLIKYECFVRYTGRQDWNRPFLSIHDLSREPTDLYARKILEFNRFKPSAVKITLLTEEGKINPKNEALFEPSIPLPLDRIDRIDAFLDIEEISLGQWRVLQGLYIPEMEGKSSNILVAYADNYEVELRNLLGSNLIGKVSLNEVIPVGSLIPIHMTKATGLRQKLTEEVPLLLRRVNNAKRVEEVNALIHVSSDIDRKYSVVITGNYS